MKSLAFTSDWVGQPCVRLAEAVEATKSTPWRRYLLPLDEDDQGFMKETRELSVKGLGLMSLFFMVVPLLWFVGLTTIRLAWQSEIIAPGFSLPVLVLLGIGGWQLSRVAAATGVCIWPAALLPTTVADYRSRAPKDRVRRLA